MTKLFQEWRKWISVVSRGCTTPAANTRVWSFWTHTFPVMGENRGFCIFMASRITTAAPSSTYVQHTNKEIKGQMKKWAHQWHTVLKMHLVALFAEDALGNPGHGSSKDMRLILLGETSTQTFGQLCQRLATPWITTISQCNTVKYTSIVVTSACRHDNVACYNAGHSGVTMEMRVWNSQQISWARVGRILTAFRWGQELDTAQPTNPRNSKKGWVMKQRTTQKGTNIIKHSRLGIFIEIYRLQKKANPTNLAKCLNPIQNV